MKKNMDSTDRAIRLALAINLAILLYTNMITGVWESVSIVAIVLLSVTSVVGICPAYIFFDKFKQK
jgi:membrane protein YdbS with pleckstrin-like domain